MQIIISKKELLIIGGTAQDISAALKQVIGEGIPFPDLEALFTEDQVFDYHWGVIESTLTSMDDPVLSIQVDRDYVVEVGGAFQSFSKSALGLFSSLAGGIRIMGDILTRELERIDDRFRDNHNTKPQG